MRPEIFTMFALAESQEEADELARGIAGKEVFKGFPYVYVVVEKQDKEMVKNMLINSDLPKNDAAQSDEDAKLDKWEDVIM